MITTEYLADISTVKAKNQGNCPTCLAFAVTDQNRRFADNDLEPRYIYRSTIKRISGWQPGDGIQAVAAAEASQAGPAREVDFSYQADEPVVPFEALPEAVDLFGLPIRFFNADVDEAMRR